MKIAVVGSGISGLSAAYYLSKKHKVDLFEKEDQFGGHANTIKVIYKPNKEIQIEKSIFVKNDIANETNQIVISGITSALNTKVEWSLEKI